MEVLSVRITSLNGDPAAAIRVGFYWAGAYKQGYHTDLPMQAPTRKIYCIPDNVATPLRLQKYAVQNGMTTPCL